MDRINTRSLVQRHIRRASTSLPVFMAMEIGAETHSIIEITLGENGLEAWKDLPDDFTPGVIDPESADFWAKYLDLASE